MKKTKTVTEIIDDLDGSKGASTTVLCLDQVRYEIDLTEENRAKLDEALRPFIEGASRKRKLSTSKRSPTGKRRYNAAQVRSWAEDQGLPVSPVGKIPAAVVKQYLEANGESS